MVEEQIEIQTYAEVQQIDNARKTNQILNNQVETQIENMDIINNQLDNIVNTLDNVQVSDIDLTEVTDKIDEIDTTIISTQNQDILETLSNQQDQINSIEEKVNIILQKLDEM